MAKLAANIWVVWQGHLPERQCIYFKDFLILRF